MKFGPSRALAAQHWTLWIAAGLVILAPRGGVAQAGSVRGRVTRVPDGQPLDGASVSVVGTSLVATSNTAGRFVLLGVPAGRQVLRVVRIGFAPAQRDVTVGNGGTDSIDVELSEAPVALGDLTVTAVSRVPERLVSAPGAVASLDLATARDLAATGQPALALTTLPGVDVVQTDVQDFNINARGFNTGFNRRVLVLQDGRDLAIPFLGAQEWLGMTATMSDMAKVEFVRGPSAALYGANAFAGVLNMTTPLARETPGARISLAGGERNTARADLRYGGVFAAGRWAYRVTGGYSRADAWAVSRTNVGDLAREYAGSIDTLARPVRQSFPGFELRALNGQSTGTPPGVPGPAAGTPDPVTGLYGTARLDYYAPGGSILTAEAGDARTRNATLVGSAARFQITESTRPWARLAWASDRFHLMAWYGGREGAHQQNLAAGTESVDHSRMLHVEGQFNRNFAGTRGRVIAGLSYRSAAVNTDGTLIAPQYDDRTDHFGAAFAQVEFEPLSKVRLVVAGRFDGSNLYDRQLSPKGAIVFSPSSSQSLRLSVGRAFEMPNSLDFFVSVPAAAPADFRELEQALRNSAVGASLAAVPQGQLFSNSAAVPLLALGNTRLHVERVTSWEAGYKGQWGRLFLELDGYFSVMNDFVTDVLPGVNPAFAAWSAPLEVPVGERAAVAAAVRDLLNAAGQSLAASALTRLEDGSTAMVLSVGNAGRATVRGLEADATWRASARFQMNANVSVFGFDLAASTFVPGDQVLPNTPSTRGNLSLMYRGRRGLDLTTSLHLTSAFSWSAGTFAGPVPATQTVNATASYAVRAGMRIQGIATNLLDQHRYQMFGGAVIGRRLLIGIDARF